MTERKLTLLPNLLTPNQPLDEAFVPALYQLVPKLKGIIAESQKEGRRFLKHFKVHLPIAVLNEHTKADELNFLLDPIYSGEHWGLISDAGMPSIADPGENLITLARKRNIEIGLISGPSSILSALLLSGMSAESFTFHGYLPINNLKTHLKGFAKNHTHLFIETPYRNVKTLQTLKELFPKGHICLAIEIGGDERVIIDQLAKITDFDALHKKPTVFVFRR
ncbi:MAG: 16S rRNA methyltransferase [Simkaniaceae bacterium]|nr:16S rRNA methyltransferase [Simkaniaceae bacterium]